MEDAVEKAAGIEDLVNLASLPQKDQLSTSLHPSRPRAQDLLMNTSAPPCLSTSNASITLSFDSSILQASHNNVLKKFYSDDSFSYFSPLQPSSLSIWATGLASAHSNQMEVNKLVARCTIIEFHLNIKKIESWPQYRASPGGKMLNHLPGLSVMLTPERKPSTSPLCGMSNLRWTLKLRLLRLA